MTAVTVVTAFHGLIHHPAVVEFVAALDTISATRLATSLRGGRVAEKDNCTVVLRSVRIRQIPFHASQAWQVPRKGRPACLLA